MSLRLQCFSKTFDFLVLGQKVPGTWDSWQTKYFWSNSLGVLYAAELLAIKLLPLNDGALGISTDALVTSFSTS